MKVLILAENAFDEMKPNLRARREARALKNVGWDVMWGDLARNLTTIGPPLQGWTFRRGRYYLRRAKRISTLAVRASPDLIIAHDVEMLRPGAVAAKTLDVPLIYDSHEDWPALISESSRTEGLLASQIETHHLRGLGSPRKIHVVVPSESVAARFKDSGPATTVLYNARYEDEIVRGKDASTKFDYRILSRTELGMQGRDFVVGCVGSLEQLFKGDTWELLFWTVESLPGMKALIIGGPNRLAARLQYYAKKFRLTDRVTVLGPMSFDKLSRYYAALDLGLILLDDRKNYRQSLPNKLFDYAAHGVPVVAPAYEDMTRVLCSHGFGWPLYGWDTDHRACDLRRTLKTLMATGSRLREWGEAGRRAFEEAFCWDRQASVFLEIVNGLIG